MVWRLGSAIPIAASVYFPPKNVLIFFYIRKGKFFVDASG